MLGSSRKTLVSFPGNMMHAQQVARALWEAEELQAYVTTFAFLEGSQFGRPLAEFLEFARPSLLQTLRRRSVGEVPPEHVLLHPGWELARTAFAQAGLGPVWVDRCWDLMSQAFDRTVARAHLSRAGTVYAFEYTALQSFFEARARGVRRVLDLPSLDSRAFEEIRRRELDAWPGIRNGADAYFDQKFEVRYARRRQEIALADCLIVNSRLTGASHVQAGADPTKVRVVPLGLPEPVAQLRSPQTSRPLEVVWAGTFQIRKGAPYFLEAWRALGAGSRARARVFGSLALPRSFLAHPPAGIEFMGSVAWADVMAAFDSADVLVFPTLSDGFGAVVGEALSRGLPVICSDQAGAADFILQGENGLLVPAGDARALKEALQWCLDNRQALAGMRMKALETARSYQWADYRRALRRALGIGASD